MNASSTRFPNCSNNPSSRICLPRRSRFRRFSCQLQSLFHRPRKRRIPPHLALDHAYATGHRSPVSRDRPTDARETTPGLEHKPCDLLKLPEHPAPRELVRLDSESRSQQHVEIFRIGFVETFPADVQL